MNDLTELAREIHEQNIAAGWWDDWPVKTDRHETAMMLVISEIAEAMEGHRKNLMDDHLPQFKMFDVEIADALIRLLDLAGAYDAELDVGEHVDTELKSDGGGVQWSKLSVPEQLWRIVQVAATPTKDRKFVIKETVIAIAVASRLNDIQIFTIMQAKREYNAKRADHKRENRAKDDGKKY